VERLGNLKGRLAKIRSKHEKGLERGLVKCGLLLQRTSQKIVPVDTGNLRASAFTRKEPIASQIIVTVGYTASYAIYVHEILTNRHKPGKQAKFLEWPARYLQPDFRRIIKEEIQNAS
jgi:hypothetical protein